MKNTTKLGLFVSQYAESTLIYWKNTKKVFKRIWRKCQKNLAVFSYAKRHKIEPISANFRPKSKIFEIFNLLLDRIERAKKPTLSLLSL